ncbi:MAG: N-acetyl-gamma-glutamyl-phosphate reductase [Endomicrobia bacterium]|nr:N-acetyl-gamma-glutamyl-phosphate reductase [Endomicrobiia bacterium]
MKNVGIVGISGITAKELLKILLRHSDVNIQCLLSSSQSKQEIEEILKFSKISKGINFFSTFDVKEYEKLSKENIDLLFLCLPHKVSMDFVKKLSDVLGERYLPKIVDLSADFRIKNIKLYEEFYETKHLLPELLENFIYGLPEIYKNKIKNAHYIANPGCYPTTIILGLAPIISKQEVNIEEIVIDAKSGYSGGGKKLVEEYEGYGGNNTYPYSVIGKHRHIPEIKEQLSFLAEREINFIFTPYVIPQYQGMLTTIYVKTKNLKFTISDLYNHYIEYYNNSPFIRVLNEPKISQTKNVIGTNYCEISFAKEKYTDWLKIFIAIDNLIKGAVGQAVQNMNLILGCDETKALI